MMIRIFSSKYIVAALATMAITYNTNNNSNGVVYAVVDVDGVVNNAKETTSQAVDTANQALSNAADSVNDAVGGIFSKENNETEIPDDVDLGDPDGEMVTDTGPDDGQEVAADADTDMEDVATPSDDVSSASLLMSSMIGIAAVTTAFVAIAL
jgi:hypothetical protein